jgi:hypothetical protein
MNNALRKDQLLKRYFPPDKIFRRVVAVFAILAFVFFVYKVWGFYNLSPRRVFNSNYSEYKLVDAKKDDSSAVRQAYRTDDYKQVVLLARSSRNIEDNFLAGHAQLAMNNAAAAVTGFKKVIDMSYVAGGSVFKEEAEYDLILSYILNRDYDLALEQMTKVKGNPGHFYHDKMTDKLFRQVKLLKWR